MLKYLYMHVNDCLECPLKKFNPKEGYFYCGHIESPENHVIIKVGGEKRDSRDYYIQDFEILEGCMPKWCPLPYESMDY